MMNSAHDDSDSDVEIILDAEPGTVPEPPRKKQLADHADGAASTPTDAKPYVPTLVPFGGVLSTAGAPNAGQSPLPVSSGPAELLPAETTPTINVDHVAKDEEGNTIFDHDMDGTEDKPWRRPGANPTDWFNYGLNEPAWKAYAAKQRRMREDEAPELHNPFVAFASGDLQSAWSQLAPEYKAMLISTVMGFPQGAFAQQQAQMAQAMSNGTASGASPATGAAQVPAPPQSATATSETPAANEEQGAFAQPFPAAATGEGDDANELRVAHDASPAQERTYDARPPIPTRDGPPMVAGGARSSANAPPMRSWGAGSRAHSPGPPTGAPTGPRAQASSGTLNGGSARRDNRRYQDKDRQDRSDRSGLEGLDYGGGGQRDQSPPGTRARGGTARERSPLSPPPQSGHGGMDRSRSGTEYSESESGRRASGNYDDLSGSASRGEAQRAPPPPLRRIRGAAAASESSSGRRGEDHGDGWATRSRYSGEYERPEKRRHEDDADERRRKMTRPQRGSGGGGREGASDGYGDDW